MQKILKYKEIIGITVVINIIVSLLLWYVVLPEAPNAARELSSDASNEVVGDSSSIVALVERANPAVLSISVTKDVPIARYPDFSPFEFFRSPFAMPGEEDVATEEREVGGGSGFIVSPDGLVITNKHVVSDTDARYRGTSSTGEQYNLEVVARDQFMDIAVLQIQGAPSNLPYLTFGESSELQLGQTVVAIGNALNEFRNSVSVGVISGLSRSVIAGSSLGEVEQLEEVIQTDAAINPGNSGGPLLNLQGQVVGVNVAVALGSENIGFALPADSVRRIVASIEEHGEIIRPYLGVRYAPITPALAAEFDLPVENGAFLAAGEPGEGAVIPGSPAAQAGLQEGDIIVSVDGEQIDQETSLGSLIQGREVGDTIDLEILREGNRLLREVTLERAPTNLNQ